jgi:hypothetical protein
LYHNVNGEILEVTGLKGKLDDLELYLKLRLNIHPSHMRRQKFDRGPLLHKTRRLKGNSSLVFNELFTVSACITLLIIAICMLLYHIMSGNTEHHILSV